jgi:hypothetical protein
MKVNHNSIFKYYQQGIYPNADKLYAIGDIHGDFKAFVLVLKKAGLIDNNYHWIGGDAHVVQVGDILDRKIRDTEYSDEDSEFKLISLILTLQLESYVQGGGFHPIIGNHELMNILGIFDYVSPMGLKHFKNSDPAKNITERRNYFKVGGDFCKYMACGWNPVVKIGDYMFCHGGINMNIANKYSIEDINYVMRDTLYGNTKHLNTKYFNELFLDPNSILWNRTYSVDLYPNKQHYENEILKKILKKYKSKYLVLGHTPQNNGINVRFNGKVFCVDTGMSEAFGKKKNKLERLHFLKILQNKNEISLN